MTTVPQKKCYSFPVGFLFHEEGSSLPAKILGVRWVGKYEKKNRSSLEIVPCARFVGHPTKHHS
jgi:hypothetical protein